MPKIPDWLNKFLIATSWQFDKIPPMYGWFHLTCLAIMIVGAIGFYFLGKKYFNKAGKWIIFAIGVILAVYGTYRQFYLSYYIRGGATYNFNYFPFQVCSIFVYLCLLTPLLKGKARELALDFMTTYCFIGGLGVLLYPDTTFSINISLDIYGMLWHSSMVWVAAFCFASREAPDRARLKNLFVALCGATLVAQLINIIGYKGFFTKQGIDGFNCFFISPYINSKNPVLEWCRMNLGGHLLSALYVVVYHIGVVILCLIERRIKCGKKLVEPPKTPIIIKEAEYDGK